MTFFLSMVTFVNRKKEKKDKITL